MSQVNTTLPGANICEKRPGTDRSDEAPRAESGGWVLGEGQPAPPHQQEGLGSAVSSLVESGAKPQPKSNLVHFSLNI